MVARKGWKNFVRGGKDGWKVREKEEVEGRNLEKGREKHSTIGINLGEYKDILLEEYVDGWTK